MKPKDILALTDPLDLNERAIELGIDFALLKAAAANHEAERKALQIQIRDELVNKGASRTAALEDARADRRYVEYVKRGIEIEENRDRAEVLYRVALQRAALLATAPTLLTGAE